MALILRGKSKCSICGLTLESGQDIVLHPHFLTSDHPLWKFSDSGMHRACYDEWDHRNYFEAAHRKLEQLRSTKPVHLRRSAGEIQSLSIEERQRFWSEVEEWSLQLARAEGISFNTRHSLVEF